MIRAAISNDLAQAVPSVVKHARTAPHSHFSGGAYLNAACPNLHDIGHQHLNAVGVYTTQVRFHQRIAHDVRMRFRSPERNQQTSAEIAQRTRMKGKHRIFRNR